MGKLPFGRVCFCRHVLAETGKIGFIKKPQDFLILGDIFVVENDNLAKQKCFMKKCLFQLPCQEMLWKTMIFIISGACLVTVKILIPLPEIEFKCMILRNLMRSETVIFTKPLNIKQDYFDVRRTFCKIQTENTPILSLLKIFSELLVMRGKSNLLLSARRTLASEIVVLEQLV